MPTHASSPSPTNGSPRRTGHPSDRSLPCTALAAQGACLDPAGAADLTGRFGGDEAPPAKLFFPAAETINNYKKFVAVRCCFTLFRFRFDPVPVRSGSVRSCLCQTMSDACQPNAKVFVGVVLVAVVFVEYHVFFVVVVVVVAVVYSYVKEAANSKRRGHRPRRPRRRSCSGRSSTRCCNRSSCGCRSPSRDVSSPSSASLSSS